MNATPSRHPEEASDLPPGLAENPDYEVLRELGRGGMGVVYLARNKLMGRSEVLKVVGGHLLDRGNVRERFLREIRNAAQLHHPNIVTAYSAIRAGDQIILAMEYVEGLDLARMVAERGPLPVAHAGHFVYQAALGLQHAHERGMVHRDIKPANLILARQGNRPIVKILDFGLAKATQEAPVDGGLTREGQMLGTPDYLAPEQILDAQKADIRADIYSLGCTLYYLLTGGPPFEAQSLYEILQAHHSRDATPLNLVRPEVPAELAALVAKMMAKAPEHRFQTPVAVAQALIPFFKPGEAGPRREAPGRAAPAPAPTVVEARPSPPVPIPEAIDPGPDGGLSSSRPAAKGGAGVPWIPITVGAGLVMLGLVMAWSLVGDGGRKTGETPSRPVAASPPEDRRRNGELPRQEALPPRAAPEPAEPVRLAVGESPPRDKEIAPRGAIPKAAPPAIVPGREAPDRDGPSPTAAPVPGVVRKGDAVAKKAPPASRPEEFRQLRPFAGAFRPSNPGAEPPRLGFWPMARPNDMTAWQVGDPDRVEMDRDGIHLSAGPVGNLLLTRQDDYRSCRLGITLSAVKGTEAFLALRAHLGPDGWRAITAPLYDEGGGIRAGSQSTDLRPPDRGARSETFAPGRPIRIRFQINAKHLATLLANQKETPSVSYAKATAGDYRGAVGVFLKSGAVVIHAMDVQE